MKFLREAGLIAPEEISPNDDVVPLDFTKLNNRQVGRVHSQYAVRHAHAIYVAAERASRLALLRRDLRLAQAAFRFKNKKKFKTKYELDDALVLDKEFQQLTDDITVLEAEFEMIEALAHTYEDFRNAASREMYRRGTEQAPKD